MAIISLGITSYKFVYPILGAITYLIRSNIFSFFPEKFRYSCSPLFYVFLMNIGMLFCFFFEVISLLLQSNEQKSFKSNFFDFFYKYKEYPSNTFLLVLLAIVDFTGSFLNTFISKISSQLLCLSQISEFFFVIVLNYLILKQSIHRHHYVALFFIISGIIVLSFKEIKFDSYIFISILCNFFFSVLIIIEAWIMEYRFLSPYELIGFKGFYGIIILTLILIVSNFTKCEKWMPFCKYDENKPQNIIDFKTEFSNIFQNVDIIVQVLSFIILTMIYNIFQALTMKHLGLTTF